MPARVFPAGGQAVGGSWPRTASPCAETTHYRSALPGRLEREPQHLRKGAPSGITKSILAWTFIRKRSRWRFGIPNWLWSRSSKPKRDDSAIPPSATRKSGALAGRFMSCAQSRWRPVQGDNGRQEKELLISGQTFSGSFQNSLAGQYRG
jgi:hypothetical protein